MFKLIRLPSDTLLAERDISFSIPKILPLAFLWADLWCLTDRERVSVEDAGAPNDLYHMRAHFLTSLLYEQIQSESFKAPLCRKTSADFTIQAAHAFTFTSAFVFPLPKNA